MSRCAKIQSPVPVRNPTTGTVSAGTGAVWEMRTPENPLWGVKQGPDKILILLMSVQIRTILGSKTRTCMCHNLDNFEPLAKVCTGIQTILMGEPKLIRSGVSSRQFILLWFFGAFCYVCAESRQFQLSVWGLCRSPDNIVQRKFFLRPDDSQFGWHRPLRGFSGVLGNADPQYTHAKP